MYCFHGESIFFRTKLIWRRFPNPLFSRGTQEISVRREILSQKNTLYVLHREPLSEQGRIVFLTVKFRKRFHPSVPYYSRPLFPTIANHCSLHYNLSPQAGLLAWGCVESCAIRFSALNTCNKIFFFDCHHLSPDTHWYLSGITSQYGQNIRKWSERESNTRKMTEWLRRLI